MKPAVRTRLAGETEGEAEARGGAALSFPWDQGAGLGRGARTLPTPVPSGFTTEKPAAVGPGQAAQIQLRKEEVKKMYALKAKVRAKPAIRGREVQLGTCPPSILRAR